MDKDNIAKIAREQLYECIQYKQPRIEEINKSYEQYYNKVGLIPKGYKKIPIPVMSGYVQTLMAKIDDPVKVSFEPIKQADYLGAKRISALWDIIKDKANYDQIDRWVKKSAIFAGVGGYKVWSDSINGKFEHHLETINFEDLIFEPNAGTDLQKHRFKGQYNLKRSKSELQELAKEKIYDKSQVRKLVSMEIGSDGKLISEDPQAEESILERYAIRGLDPREQQTKGDIIYNFAEMTTKIGNTEYYILFETSTGIWVRMEDIKDNFEVSPFVAWLIDEDAKDFCAKSLADDIKPLHTTINLVINDMLNNVAKRNYGQRAFDPTMFKNASLLQFRRDGLIPADTKNGLKKIQDGIFTFETPDTTSISLNIAEYLDAFFGTKTGITPDTQGTSEEDKVGIYYGNLQQAADRLGLINKSYKKAHQQLAERFLIGVGKAMTNKYAVRLIGTNDIEYVTKHDAEPEYDIQIESTSNAERLKEINEKRRSETLSAIVANPALLNELNPKKTVEELLAGGEWDEQDVKEFMDKDFYGNREILAKADSAVQMIKENKDPEICKTANQVFCQRFAEGIDNIDLKPEQLQMAEQYLQIHWKFAIQNAIRKANMDAMNLKIDGIKQQLAQPVQPIGQPMQPTQPEQPRTNRVNLPQQEIPQENEMQIQ